MKTFSFYEQCGILIPGSVFLFGLTLWVPTLTALFSKDGISVGGLGLFLILAYAAGHAVAAVGNLIERVFWKLWGGMPSDWITFDSPKILSASQVDAVSAKLEQRLGVDASGIRGVATKNWAPIFGQLYRDVLANNPGRAETFNGNYGLNRGLAAALLCLVPVAIVLAPQPKGYVIVGLVVLIGIYLFRMYRFGVHFAREIYFSFLNSAKETSSKPKANGGE